MGGLSVSGLGMPDGAAVCVRQRVRVSAVAVRVERDACPGSGPRLNPDTRESLGLSLSGFREQDSRHREGSFA